MKKETIFDAINHEPHRVKTLRLSDGSSVEVPHPDQILFPGTPAVAVVFNLQGGFRIVNLTEIVSVDVPAKPAKKTKQ